MKKENSTTDDPFLITVASAEHVRYAEELSKLIEQSAKARQIGIAKREPEYIAEKMRQGKAVIALHESGEVAGFSYIETWSHNKYVANSGLIVAPKFRNMHLGRRIKEAIFELSRKTFPDAKIFSITTSHAVMKMNTDLNFKPVPFSELTDDEEFWDGCKTCKNYDILTKNNRKYCVCTGLLYDPAQEKKKPLVIRDNRTVVLAFSGGLDTSYCAIYLAQELGLEVHSVVVDTGGFSEQDLKEIEERARLLGVKKHVVLDEQKAFYDRCIKYLVFGNVLKNNTYPLSVSSERIFQALAIANYAREVNAGYIAHGSTGAGNDQIRFDMAFSILAPEVEILTPIRDQALSRNEEIEYLRRHGIELDWEQAMYSINKGIWGTSVGGRETLNSYEYLPEEAFPTPLQKKGQETVELEFCHGELCGINGEKYENPIEAIHALEQIAGPYAVGRDIHVGDTIIGIKGRVGFEAAAPMVIIKAHHALEKHVLTKWQLYWKDQMATWYGNLLHEGQYLDPVMRNIEAFFEDTQKTVNGTVSVSLSPYHFHILGVTSPHDLMSPEIAVYGEIHSGWTGEDVKGFAKIAANQAMIYYKVNRDEL